MCSLTQQSKPVSALAPNRKSSTILKLLMVSQTALHISKKGNNRKSSAKTITLILDWKHILTFSQKFKRTKLFCSFKKAQPFSYNKLFALSIDTQVNWFWVTMIASCKILTQLHFCLSRICFWSKFMLSHPVVFEAANWIVKMTPRHIHTFSKQTQSIM